MEPTLPFLEVEEVRQTHISWVFLTADEAWKIKKPVNFGFLDFSTLEGRHQACQDEVRLNQRLAPEVYRGVVPLAKNPAGGWVPTDGAPQEWAVTMRRLPDHRRADLLLQAGELQTDDIDAMAQTLARFHGSVPRDPAFGSLETISHNVRENFSQAGECPDAVVGTKETLEIEAGQLQFLHEHVGLVEQRMANGAIREGHGDLRLEHIYVDGAPVVLDCIEFNQRFRYADVASDYAFLSMDLARLGRGDLAERLLAQIAKATGDYQLYRLIDFYEGYRAFVRGKVACFALQSHPGDPGKMAEARQYFLMALACGRKLAMPAQVIAVGGLIGAGKSTLADAVSLQLGCPVVQADSTRKQLMGIDVTQKVHDEAFQGAYDPGVTDQVYEEIMRRAGHVLASGRSVILDASFRAVTHRRAAVALAETHDVPYTFVECRAPRPVLEKRLQARERQGSVSDGRLAILDEFLAAYQPPKAHEALVIDTQVPLDQCVDAVLARLG